MIVNEINDFILKIFYNWFICNFEELDMVSFMDFFFDVFILEYEIYVMCLGFWNKIRDISIEIV